MTRVYDSGLAQKVATICRKSNIDIRKGVYAGLLGPSLETPAEIRFLRTIGADAVGFSTIQEVIAAVHARMKIVGLSIITNINDPDNPSPASVEAILDVANQAAPVVDRIISELVGRLETDQNERIKNKSRNHEIIGCFSWFPFTCFRDERCYSFLPYGFRLTQVENSQFLCVLCAFVVRKFSSLTG